MVILLNNTHFKQSLTANLLKKIGITISVTVVTFVILLLYSYEVYHQYIWQEYDLVYQVAQIIKDNLVTISITLIAFDTIIIFWLRYRESLQNKKAIKQAEQQRNDLLLYLAHDLKTPLTSIVGYLDLLMNQPNLTIEEKSNYTKIAYDKAIRLEELIEEFFSIAKYNLSDISLERKAVNLSMMLVQISYEFMPLYHEKNINCVTKIEDNLFLELDINQFERVFDNLIRNAINYSKENSDLIITAKKEVDCIFIQVANFVKHISEHNLERIFQPFVRLDEARNSKTGGSGLGLAITKKIIELHGGTIEADLTDDLITFTIKLPI